MFKLLKSLYSTHFTSLTFLPSLSFSPAIFLSIESSSVYAPAIYYITQNRTDRTMFYCSISGNHAFWGINGTTVSDGGGDAWTDSGFTFDSRIIDQDQMGNQHILQNTLGVPALMEYNNTVIFCAVLVGSGHQPVQSNSVKIVVMGKFIRYCFSMIS